MNQAQDHEIRGRQRRLKMSDAELMQLAQELHPTDENGLQSRLELDAPQPRALLWRPDTIERAEVRRKDSREQSGVETKSGRSSTLLTALAP